jgi:hypothetical protein
MCVVGSWNGMRLGFGCIYLWGFDIGEGLHENGDGLNDL